MFDWTSNNIAKYLENCKNITVKKNAENPELISLINYMKENIIDKILLCP